MGENLTLSEDTAEQTVEKKEKIYPSISEYLSAFEESPQFNQEFEGRKTVLLQEHPNLDLDRKDLVAGMRIVPAYRYALEAFFRVGNHLPTDLNVYNDEVKKAIQEYWNYLGSMPHHISIVRATAKDKEDEEMKLFRMEKTRDRFHTFAGLALMGEGVALKNGQKITCNKISPEDESAINLESYATLGRSLISIITEEIGEDYFDPEREEKKAKAALEFLNGCNYSSGHWVAKGEK